jgi:hypothetical protein
MYTTALAHLGTEPAVLLFLGAASYMTQPQAALESCYMYYCSFGM